MLHSILTTKQLVAYVARLRSSLKQGPLAAHHMRQLYTYGPIADRYASCIYVARDIAEQALTFAT